MLKGSKSELNIKSSFRDPCGAVFIYEGALYRQVNLMYKDHYDCLMEKGLYAKLTAEGLLVSHAEINAIPGRSSACYKVIHPQKVNFISYPYEWCFSQLKNAALTTLKIQKIALDFGMILKDANAYNIQFKNGKPIFIDTLSFEIYSEGSTWIAYRQFCQHFLAPLALMSYTDVRLSQLLRSYIDGIPLDLASKLLPFHSYFNFLLLVHIHLHAKSQKYFADKDIKADRHKICRVSLLGLVDSLESAIKALKWKPKNTEWADYYENNNYSQEALEHKKQILSGFLNKINIKNNIWDFGANTGMFSRIAANKNTEIISFDFDPSAVEKNYLECVQRKENNILPLLLDLSNPTPAIGWNNRERMSLKDRAKTDVVIALALIHHLVISNNIPLKKIAEFFNEYTNWLIIEFVPKSDSNAKRLLRAREDVFLNYTETTFKEEFSLFFQIVDSIKVKDSERIVYLMKNKDML